MDIALWDDEFSNKLAELRTDVDSLSRYQAGSSAKGQAVSKCEKLLRNIEGETKKLFKMELRQIEDAKTKQSFQQKYSDYNKQLETLKTELKWAMKDALIGEKKEQAKAVSRDEMLQRTNQLQDQTEESLARTRQLAEETVEMGQEGLETLQDQTKQINDINDSVQNINDELSKAEALLKSILRRMMTDKLVLCFVGLIFIGIIAIIIYVAVNPAGAQNLNVPPVVIPPIPGAGSGATVNAGAGT